MKKSLKVLLIVVAVLVVLAAALYFFVMKPVPITLETLDLDTAAVTRGSIESYVHGSGTLEVDVTRDVYCRVSGQVKTVERKDGDTVLAGELIATLESEDLENSLRSYTDDLYLRELELSSSRLGRTVTNINAPIAGRVKLLKARKGDEMTTVQKQYGALAVISSDGKMRVNVNTPDGYKPAALPMDVKVQIGDKVADGTLLSADDQQLSVVIDDDSYDAGATATVRDMSNVELGSGTLAVNKPVVVAGVAGKIKTVEAKENDKVKAGDRLFTLEDDAVTVDAEKKLVERDQLQRNVDDTREKIGRLEIRAPISGVIANLTLREGASINNGQQVCTIIQTDNAKVRLAVDELDIARVLPGQSATLKVDAIPGKTYQATVDRVLPLGTRAGEITTYDVILYVRAQDNMLPYMSVSGDILVNRADGALLVPATAIQTVEEKTYVMLAPTDADLVGVNASSSRKAGMGFQKMTGQSQNSDVELLQSAAPQLMQQVEIGLASGDMVQVLSGLAEGEKIVLPRTGTNLLGIMMRSNNGGGSMSSGLSGGETKTSGGGDGK